MAEYKFNPVKVAKKILKTRKILCVHSHFFIYKKNSVFEVINEFELYKIIFDMLGDKYRERFGTETRHCLLTECYVRTEDINKDKNLINIKNGMYNLKTMEVLPHDPKYLSTKQLPVEYDNSSKCDLWIETLNQIFIGKKWKIDLLPEYMGYCLTADHSHQQALINSGQRATAKSLIFKILEKILG